MSGRVCGGCGVAGGDKYKCAACKQFKYCSVACYRKHQAESCPAASAQAQQPAAAAASSSTAEAAAGASSQAAAAASPAAAAAAAATPASAAAPSATAAAPKSSTERVSPLDLDRLASSPSILSALESAELRSILRRIDGGDAASGLPAGTAGNNPSDEQRVAALEKFRTTNPDFEAFVQKMIAIINQE